MNQSTTLAVVGGDVRQAYLAELLHEAGHTVRTFALKAYIHAVLQAYDTFDRICRNKTPLELVAR